MKIELKNVSYSKRLSQETSAFAATVYVDGKKAGDARNDGGGGLTMVDLHLLPRADAMKVISYCESLPDHVYPANEFSKEFKVKMDLEQMVGNLLEAYLNEKHEKAQYVKWCKKDVCFRVKGDKIGSYRLTAKDKGVYTLRVKDLEDLRRQYRRNPQ